PPLHSWPQRITLRRLRKLLPTGLSMSNVETGSGKLRRELKSRHLAMIAIGGSIGTGLFVASGATIAEAGPGGALLSYALIGLMVYFLMTSLGELAAYMRSEERRVGSE